MTPSCIVGQAFLSSRQTSHKRQMVVDHCSKANPPFVPPPADLRPVVGNSLSRKSDGNELSSPSDRWMREPHAALCWGYLCKPRGRVPKLGTYGASICEVSNGVVDKEIHRLVLRFKGKSKRKLSLGRSGNQTHIYMYMPQTETSCFPKKNGFSPCLLGEFVLSLMSSQNRKRAVSVSSSHVLLYLSCFHEIHLCV